MNVKKNIVVAVMALAVFGSTVSVMAQDAPKDRLKVHLKALYTYNDNVFQWNNEQNDYFYTLFAGIDTELGPRMARFGLEGEVRSLDYDEFDNQDDTEYSLNPRAVFGGHVLTLGLYGEFTHEIRPVDSTNVTQVENHFDTGRVVLTIKPSDHFGIELAGAVTDAIYDTFDTFDYFRTEYSVSLFKEFSDKTTVGVKYLWADFDYDEDVRYDGETERYTLYIDYSISGKVSAHVEGGIESHEYDLTVGTVGDPDKSVDEWYFDVSVAYSPTEKFDVEVGVTRSITQGSSPTSSFYVETRPYLDVAFAPTDKLTMGVRGYFADTNENNAYDSKTTRLEAKINYAIREWLELEASHEYTQRDSDSPTGDFHRNVTTAGFVLRF